MSRLNYLVLCSAIVAAGLKSTNALTDEEKAKVHESLMPALTECGPKFGIDRDAFKEAKAKDDFEAMDPCFFACMFKKIGFMNDKGDFDPEATMTKVKEIVKTEEDITNVGHATKVCTSVNDESVKDGAEGCERAVLLLKCFRQHKDQFTL